MSWCDLRLRKDQNSKKLRGNTVTIHLWYFVDKLWDNKQVVFEFSVDRRKVVRYNFSIEIRYSTWVPNIS